ncbi:hypothetical protein [Variovorax sp. UMC13]|uniref:hypothetical protein n=1 Tax=Variovorax sp. UMC13 TaxID=1862326 RepID=UPI001603E45C|nr:hypothetical protein [Variovorax sp. UMC13]
MNCSIGFLFSFRFTDQDRIDAVERGPESPERAIASIQPLQVQIEGLARPRKARPDRPEVVVLRIDDLAIPAARAAGGSYSPSWRELEHPRRGCGNRPPGALKKKHPGIVVAAGFVAPEMRAAHILGATRDFAEL